MAKISSLSKKAIFAAAKALLAEVNGNRTHLWAFDPYNDFEDREAHQLPFYLHV